MIPVAFTRGAAELKSFAREAAEKTLQQCRELLERAGDWKEPLAALRAELLSSEKELKGQGEAVAEVRKEQQRLEERQEQAQRRGVDMSSELQQLREKQAEQAAQAERLSKSLEAEMKKGR